MRTALALLLLAGAAYADGLVVDRRERPVTDLFTVKNHFVKVAIDDQHAVTEVDQTLRNVGGQDTEVVYIFPIPKNANITGFEIWVGDKKMEGEILKADKARSVYNELVRAKRDPALLEYVGLGVYRTTLFPFGHNEEKRLRIRYSELLEKDSGLVRYVYPLNTEKFSKHPLEEARVEVTIASKGRIKTVYSPSHSVDVSRASDTGARAVWSVQRDWPRTDFELLYSTDEGDIGANLITFRPDPSEPGYFVLLASPKVKFEGKPEPKDIVFVLDKSGSMRPARKLDQAKEALVYCLRSLNEGDRFGIVVYSSGVEKYADRLVDYRDAEREKAVAYVERIAADGGTNINEALIQGLTLFQPDSRLKMIIFLTDGLPTVGVTQVPDIVRNVKAANAANIRLFNFGVGYDVNTTLLDKLARENSGDSEYVKPGENLEVRVSGFYSKVQSPVLSTIKVDWGGIKTREVQPRQVPDLFKGGQLVIVGRYETAGRAVLAVTGMAQGKEQKFEFPVVFEEKSEGTAKLFVERLWAQRQIGYIIDQIQLYGKTDELVNEIVRLSTKYGIITEYTSFLTRDDVRLSDRKANFDRARGELDKLKEDTGQSGNRQAEAKKAFQSGTQAPAAGGGGYLGADGKRVEVKHVQNVGRRTFFQKNKVWQEADVPEGVQPIEVKFFSDEFFKLLDENAELNQIAALDGDVIVKLGEKHYKLAK